MKKLIQILIVCLVGLFFVGCGDKKSEVKSPAVIKCEEGAKKLGIPLAEGGLGMEPKLVECFASTCTHYEGGETDEEIGKWIFGKDEEKEKLVKACMAK